MLSVVKGHKNEISEVDKSSDDLTHGIDANCCGKTVIHLRQANI